MNPAFSSGVKIVDRTSSTNFSSSSKENILISRSKSENVPPFSRSSSKENTPFSRPTIDSKSPFSRPRNDNTPYSRQRSDNTSLTRPRNDNASFLNPRSDNAPFSNPRSDKTSFLRPTSDTTSFSRSRENTPFTSSNKVNSFFRSSVDRQTDKSHSSLQATKGNNVSFANSFKENHSFQSSTCSDKVVTGTSVRTEPSSSFARTAAGEVTSSGPSSSGNLDTATGVVLDGDDENGLPQIYLSLHMSANKLGAAYYDVSTSILYLMPDIVETTDHHFLKQLFAQVGPHSIITSSKQKESFIEFLQQTEYQDKVEIMPQKGFTFELCKLRIYGLNGIGNLTEGSSDEERSIFFSSIVTQNNFCMVCAAGGLLKYLDQALLTMELEDPGAHVPVLMLKMFNLSNLLFVDQNTYSALQIFHKEWHPSVYKSFGEGKEGLSLFGIMNHARSSQGSALLREWFLRASTDVALLQQRHNAIAYLISPTNTESVSAIQDALRNTKNIMGILSKMKSTGVRLIDWDNLYKTLFNAICLGDICQRLPQDIVIFHDIRHAFSKEILLHMANLIKQIINFEESSYANHFVVNDGVDAELDEKKRAFDGIPYLMTKVAQEELSKLNSSITKCSVTYLPQLGYLLNLPLTKKMKETSNYNVDDELEFKFVADDLVYYKSSGTKDLDERLGDIHFDIRDHEMAIMHRLQNIILEHTSVIHRIVELSAELDCLLSLAHAARELNLKCPIIRPKEDNVIKIVGGRHPLQELCVNQFVPNDTWMDETHGCLHILTAPNASGKSVYLKQVALIVYLAQIGSFVPAEHAEISIRDAIFTRIHAKESVSIPLSTFMIDLNQIAYAAVNTTKYSLVIIDEFGKGTSSVDGLALLCATMKYWLSKGDGEMPSILVSTHFHRLTSMIPESQQVRHQTFAVMESDDELVFLHKLKEGFVEHSHAHLTALSVKIPQHILHRAKKVSGLVRSGAAITQRNTTNTIDESTKLERIGGEFFELNIDTDDVQAFLKRLNQSNKNG